jgi:hypothetical protein
MDEFVLVAAGVAEEEVEHDASEPQVTAPAPDSGASGDTAVVAVPGCTGLQRV